MLGPETSEECERFGVVLNCQVHESQKEKNAEEAVKVYVKFKYPEQALKGVRREMCSFSFFPLHFDCYLSLLYLLD
jgi:hypothetical protein